MKGHRNTPMDNDSPEEVLDAFKNFCRRRSKRAMSHNTLGRYEQAADVLSRKHGLRLGRVDLDDLERIVTERSGTLTCNL